MCCDTTLFLIVLWSNFEGLCSLVACPQAETMTDI